MNDIDSPANNLEAARVSAQQPWLQVQGSRYFLDWLQEQRVSLAFTTYQTGKLFLVGRKPDQAISVFERTYSHCMGMWAAPDGRTIWLSSRYQIWRLQQTPAAAVPYAADGADQLPAEAAPPSWCGRGYDVAYLPRVGYTTGHLDVHDMAWEPVCSRRSVPERWRPARGNCGPGVLWMRRTPSKRSFSVWGWHPCNNAPGTTPRWRSAWSEYRICTDAITSDRKPFPAPFAPRAEPLTTRHFPSPP